MLKNKHLATFSFFILYFVSTTLANVELTSIFTEGNKAYNNKEFSKADSLYRQIEAEGYYSRELFYNLGNTNYKLEKIPETVYYYEKALKLSPSDEEIVYNLTLANKRISDKSSFKTSPRIEDVIYTYVKSKTNFWSITSIVLMFISGLLLILFLLLHALKLKKLTFYGGIVFLLLGLSSIYLSSLQNKKLTKEEFGIVFASFIELKMEPSENASPAFVLHEGTKVKLLNQNENWYEISFDKGKVAWIKKTALKTF